MRRFLRPLLSFTVALTLAAASVSCVVTLALASVSCATPTSEAERMHHTALVIVARERLAEKPAGRAVLEQAKQALDQGNSIAALGLSYAHRREWPLLAHVVAVAARLDGQQGNAPSAGKELLTAILWRPTS